MYTNTDQFLNKREDLSMLIAGCEPDLIMLTEAISKTQVKPISTATLALPGYAVYLNFEPATENFGSSGCRGCAFLSGPNFRLLRLPSPTVPFGRR